MTTPSEPFLRTGLRALLAGAAAALVAGCAVVVEPPSAVPSAIARHDVAGRGSPAAVAADVPAGEPTRVWWSAYRDPSLDALVRRAVDGAYDLKVAVAAVRAARAMVDAAQRESLPQGGLAAQPQARRPATADADIYRLGLPRPPRSELVTAMQTLSWEVDLFGRIGTAASVAERRADLAVADLHAARAMLHGEVVRQYVGLRGQQQALALLDDEGRLVEARIARLRSRADTGLVDRREALAAEADRSRLAAEREQLRAGAANHAAAIAVLLGQSPTARDASLEALLAPAPLPAVPAHASIVRPDDLLARRPDVARADAQLRAAVGEQVLAERAHLPRLTLNLAFGVNALFGSLGDPGALRYTAGPALQWDWLDAGRLRAREAAARAGRDAAWHGFERTVLTALQDSEASLRQWGVARVALAQARDAERAARQAHAYAQGRVSAGLEPASAAIERATQVEQARRRVLAAQADALLAYAQVQLALGAWQPAHAGEAADAAATPVGNEAGPQAPGRSDARG